MPRGRNKKRLLECGLGLIWRQGFHATGVQQIADASGVPKGSFYNYFESKEDFVIQALERYTESGCELLETTLVDGEGSPLMRLRALFQGSTKSFFAADKGCGCFAANLGQELATQNLCVRKSVDRAFRKILAYYTACLEEARLVGEIGPNEDVGLLAAFIYNGWQGAVLRTKACGNTEPLVQFQKFVFERLLT